MYTLVILNEREKPTIILFRKLIVLEWFNYANRIIRVSISSKIHHIIIISMYDVYDNILYSMYMSRYSEKKTDPIDHGPLRGNLMFKIGY
jgi:hypothetical protein